MKYELEDIIGIRSGKLVIVGPFEYEENDKGRKIKKVWCQCDCGNKVLLPTPNIISGTLISCGCIRKNGEYTKRKLIKYEDIVGRKSGMLTVLGSDIIEKYKGNDKYRERRILCKCDCGNVTEIRAADFGRTFSCGCTRIIHKPEVFEGKRFGKLIAIKYESAQKILCKCDCGQECYKTADNLIKSKGVIDCGCSSYRKYHLEDFIGKRFGKLTVIGPEKSEYDDTIKKSRRFVLCKCDCGKTTYIGYIDLIRGHRTSCGCNKRERLINAARKANTKYNIEDYVGKKFGALTITNEFTTKKESGYNRTLYKCNCDCGKYIYARLGRVVNGNITSCGCGIYRLGKEN